MIFLFNLFKYNFYSKLNRKFQAYAIYAQNAKKCWYKGIKCLKTSHFYLPFNNSQMEFYFKNIFKNSFDIL